MPGSRLFRLAAFSFDGRGGNPAGVWVGDELPLETEMQRIAADVGASETAFIAPTSGSRRTVRYYSPEIEVSFCGHATIASGVALARDNTRNQFTFITRVGDVIVKTRRRNGQPEASLQSVATSFEPVDSALLQQALDCLGWSFDELDAEIPPAKAYAGAWHLVVAVRSRETLARLDYDFDALKALMQHVGLTTCQLVWREDDALVHSRNPFPVGGVVEDPATGAAAAALGGYFRDAGLVAAPFGFEVRQGEDMGKPSLIRVEVPAGGGIIVSGTARDL